jgi:hypothetical protein
MILYKKCKSLFEKENIQVFKENKKFKAKEHEKIKKKEEKKEEVSKKQEKKPPAKTEVF